MTQPASSPRSLTLETGTNPSSRIEIGQGVLASLSGWLSSRPPARLALVTDTNVERLHAGTVRQALAEGGHELATTSIIPAGESAKTRTTKEMVEDALVTAGLSRDSLLIALGGGVVSDLAGFTAATYMRGIPWVVVPTTLLGMVDASIGGKTGVDHPRGKNLIGAFHQPAAVFADVGTLATLPEREYRSGLAELVKTAVVGDAVLFDRMIDRTSEIGAREPRLMTELIVAACRFKAAVVAADEREGDLRMILNFGHTIGHALELISDYRLAHGEAVSIGMVAESRIAVKLGLLSARAAVDIEAALVTLQLPVRLPSTLRAATPEMILDAARHDKKTRGDRIVLALPEAIGRMARSATGYGIRLEERHAIDVLSELA